MMFIDSTMRAASTVRAMRICVGVVTATMLVVTFSFPVLAGNIDATDQHSWGENIGWLVWGTTEGDVTVGLTELTGYLWGENIGWVSLNCSTTSSCGTVDYSVARNGSTISGYAWGENVGWISFNCMNTSSCGTVSYSTSYNESTGEFSGHAWGENIGWIVMNCSTTSSCGTVDYKVSTSTVVTPTPTPTPGVGGVPGSGPAPTASPTESPTETPLPAIPSPSATPVATPPAITPTPGVTPVVSPPSAPPPVSPPPDAPTGPPPSEPGIPGVIDRVSDRLDRAGDRVGGFIDRLVGQPVESGAGAATAVALVPLLWALVEIVQTRSAGAAAYSLLQAVGLKKKTRVWGTVYDSHTKHPIPFVRVQILDEANRILENRFADRDGRYGFLLSPPSENDPVRKVRIVAKKEGYGFPSKEVGPGTDYLVYERVYSGEVIEVVSDTTLTYDIPMDPVLVSGKPARPPFAAVISKSWETVLNVGFYAGLVLVPYNMILHPTTANFIIGALFFGANAIRIFKIYRPYGNIKDVASGETVPFSLVTLHDEAGKRLSFSVSDEVGRYFLSTQGEQNYQIRVHTPANMIPPRSAAEDIPSDSKQIKSGWITKDMRV